MAASEGVITGPSPDWLPLPEGGLRVNSALLEMPEDYGPRLFQGRPFTGVAYAFTRNGYCTSEVEYAGGFATEVSERRWYVSGQPKMHVDGGEYTSWFPDGRIQRRGLKGELVYGLNTRDDGHLRELVLRDASFLDMEILSALTPTEEFQMLGGAVDTAMLHTLREQTDIGAVPRLRLVQTRVGAEGVEILAAFKNLREVWFDGNPGLDSRRPGSSSGSGPAAWRTTWTPTRSRPCAGLASCPPRPTDTRHAPEGEASRFPVRAARSPTASSAFPCHPHGPAFAPWHPACLWSQDAK